MTLRVGTRGSQLARTQTLWVMARLEQSLSTAPDWTEVVVKTEGDEYTGELSKAPTPGIFVSRLREELLAGRVDVIVHSMKDLPAAPYEAITLAAVPQRENPADVLISRGDLPLSELAPGSVVGTSSPRRAASIRRARPDLRPQSIRGNITTRIDKVLRGDYDATVLARAGLARIDALDQISEELDSTVFLPAPRQAALAVECRSDDDETLAVLQRLDDPVARLCTRVEQAILIGLDAGCHTAVSALATWEPGGEEPTGGLTLRAELADADTGEVVSTSGQLQSSFDALVSDEATAWNFGLEHAQVLASTALGRALGKEGQGS
ncbi:hydroxymethylbilane synthase [Pontimonas sp.]|uniref:hydroxymethylbilane synthase n=1 Tax=Pontimonas sp. TaxID=2304492 RepID=UPI0028700AB9|nr:hydroxymethylbilane synthase [Pontimonas sp.]MDR9397131.1 hydroxymethylbilane synthase [Pontimonas sp.]